MKADSISSTDVVASVAHPTGTTALPLRRDEIIPGGFLLELLLALVVLLGALALLLKWLKKRQPGLWSQPQDRHMRVVETLRTSPRTRVSLLLIQGKYAVVTETPQGASLQFVPSEESNSKPALDSDALTRQGPEV